MSTLNRYIQDYFPGLRLYGMESENILTKTLCEEYSTDDDIYISTCYKRAIDLFEYLYDKQDDIIVVINSYEEKNNYSFGKIRIGNYLKNKDVLKTLNCISTDGKYLINIFDNDEIIYHYYLSCKVIDLNYKKLILDLCRHDLDYKVDSMKDYFIINKSKKACYRMMDDRFVDLIFEDKISKQEFDYDISKIY